MPRIFAISGAMEFLQRRQVASTIDVQRQNGWRIQTVDGDDVTGVQAALTQGGGMFADDTPLLVVIRNPEKTDLAMLEQHRDDKTSNVMLLLDIQNDPKMNTKFGKFVGSLGPKAHKGYPFPDKKWELPKMATEFCIQEALRLKKTMAENIAQTLVKRCGTDYGFLAFEIQKFAMLADARGVDAIRVEELRDVMSAIGDVSFDSVKDALVSRNRRRMASALDRVNQSVKDPIMGLCGYMESIALGRKADGKSEKPSVGWLHLSVLIDQGISPENIANQLGMNPWFCQKTLLPEVRAWKPDDVINLIRVIAESRRGVLNGHIDPWTGLVARLLELCR